MYIIRIVTNLCSLKLGGPVIMPHHIITVFPEECDHYHLAATTRKYASRIQHTTKPWPLPFSRDDTEVRQSDTAHDEAVATTI